MFYSGTTCLRGLQSTTPATTNEPEASEVLHLTRNHHHVPNHRSNFTKQPKKKDFQNRLSFWPTFSQCANLPCGSKNCPVSCTCHAPQGIRLQNVPKVPRLLTQHGHCSKNKHGAPVKRELWKNGLQIPWQAWHFVRCDENWRKPGTKHRFWGSKFSGSKEKS